MALWSSSGRGRGGCPGRVSAGEGHRAALRLLAILHRLKQPRRMWARKCSVTVEQAQLQGLPLLVLVKTGRAPGVVLKTLSP